MKKFGKQPANYQEEESFWVDLPPVSPETDPHHPAQPEMRAGIPQPPPASRQDPQGSWTGRPEDPYETPVQDQDDL